MKKEQMRYFITARGKDDLKKGFWKKKSSAMVEGRIYGVNVMRILRIRQISGLTRTEIEDKLGLAPYYKGPKQFREEKADLVKVLRSLRAENLLESKVVPKLTKAATIQGRTSLYRQRVPRITPKTPRLRR